MMYELKAIVENAAQLAKEDNEAFAMLRRQGFGASDSSIILGVNPFPDNTVKNLLKEKQSDKLTAREMKIGQMVNVRKGSDLEPLILKKFIEKYDLADNLVDKPDAMYRIGDTPLTVNFDGIYQITDDLAAPVECKYVSPYGGKYYNQHKADHSPYLPITGRLANLGTEVTHKYIADRAQEAGIPIYYYTQIQQQMLALDAPIGYLAALFDKDWELRVFTVMPDKLIQKKLLEVAEDLWNSLHEKN